MRKCIQLDERLRKMDEEIMVNPQYVQKVRTCKENSTLKTEIIQVVNSNSPFQCSGIQDEDLPGTSGILTSGKGPICSM